MTEVQGYPMGGTIYEDGGDPKDRFAAAEGGRAVRGANGRNATFADGTSDGDPRRDPVAGETERGGGGGGGGRTDHDENDVSPTALWSPPDRRLSKASSALSDSSSRGDPKRQRKQLEKMQRRVPGSLDLDYVTTRIIGMAPPCARYPNDVTNPNEGSAPQDKSLRRHTQRSKRPKGNDPGELSTFLERRHPRRYLLFNVSDDDADDRSLLLLGRQVVHLPWGSPRVPHPHDRHHHHHNNTNGVSPGRTPGADGTPSPFSYFRKGGETTGTPSGSGGGNKSSGTPAVSRVMDICYALHAYLSVPPRELPPELTADGNAAGGPPSNKRSSRRGSSGSRHSAPPSTVACIYCGNGKTRTGVVVACYLRFCDEVPDALSGFEVFCERRGIMSSSSSNNSGEDISNHIPPSLRQFFANFDDVVRRRRYPHPEPLLLQSVQLQGVPVDDMPCLDIWEHGDVARRQVYGSHDDGETMEMNEWDDEEGSYRMGLQLDQDFTLVCRFGGEFARDAEDPSKVLFRYVNCPNFLREGVLELGMAEVDMMRRYADSFDDEDFLLTLVFETVEEVDGPPKSPGRFSGSPRRAHCLLDGRTKFRGLVPGINDVILQGWRVLSDAHLAHLPPDYDDGDSDASSAFTLRSLDNEIDFRLVALQFANGEVDLARAELKGGLFKDFFDDVMQQPFSQPPKDGKGEYNAILQPILEPEDDSDLTATGASLSSAGTGNDADGVVRPATSYDSRDVQPATSCDSRDIPPATSYDSRDGANRPASSDRSHNRPQGSEYSESAELDTKNAGSEEPTETKSIDEIDQKGQLESLKSEQIKGATDDNQTAPDHLFNEPRNDDNFEHTSGIVENAAFEEPVKVKPTREPNLRAQDEISVESPANELAIKARHKVPEELLQCERAKGATETSENVIVHQSSCAESRDDERLPAADDVSGDASQVGDAEEVSTTNVPFADPSHPSILEAIQMRGLKRTISIRSNDDANRSCLLSEIRRGGSIRNFGTGDDVRNNNDASVDEWSMAREAGLAASPGVDAVVVADRLPSATTVPQRGGVEIDLDDMELDASEGNSLSTPFSDAAVLMIGLDQSVSTGIATGIVIERDNGSVCEDDLDGDQGCSVPATLRNASPAQAVDIIEESAVSKNSEAEEGTLATSASEETILRINGDSAVRLARRSTGESNDADDGGEMPIIAWEKQASEVGSEVATSETIPLNESPHFEKYYRMLRMGLPLGAVKNAMQRDGFDPTILDLDPEKSLASQWPAEVTDVDAFGKNSTNDQYTGESCSSIRKSDVDATADSLNVRSPTNKRAIAAAAALNGTTSIEEYTDGISSSAEAPPVAAMEEEWPPLNKDHRFEKYYRMLRVGLPMGAVKNAMQRDGFDPKIMDLDPNRAFESQLKKRAKSPQLVAVAAEKSEALSSETIESISDTPSSVSSDRYDAKNALNAVLTKRGGQRTRELECKTQKQGDQTEEAEPRAALMAMISNRAPPGEQSTYSVQNDAAKSLNATMAKREGESNVKETDETTKEEERAGQADPRTALLAMLSKRAPPQMKEPKNTPSSTSSDPNDADSALNAMLSNRGGKSIAEHRNKADEQEEMGEKADPRTALMSMLSKRAFQAEEPKRNPPPKVEDQEKDDPRAALMNMLSDRVPSAAVEEAESTPLKEEAEHETKQANPREALMAMLSKRAPPPSAEEPKSTRALKEDAEQADPRAALTSMLSKRAPPPEEEPKTTPPPNEDAKDADPRAALRKMLSNRAPPPVESPKRVIAEKMEAEQADPKAALMSMLSKRVTLAEEPKSSPAPKQDAEQSDPRAALMSMLKKRAPPSAEEPENAPSLKDETEQTDPRAALMSMLNKRAPPSEEPKSGQPMKKDAEQTDPRATKEPKSTPASGQGAEKADPRAALMSMLQKRAPPLAQESKSTPAPKVETEQTDTRAALMSMLKKRAPPEEPNTTSLQKEEAEQADPRAALMTVLNKRAPQMREPKGTPPEKEEPQQADPRAALMSMLNKRAPPGEEPNIPPAKEEAEKADPRAALMSMISKRAPPPSTGEPKTSQSQKEETKQEDPRSALMSMISKRSPPNATLDEPKKTSSPKEEAQPADPRAALMSMINKRAPQPEATSEAPNQRDSGPMNIGAIAAASALKKTAPVEKSDGGEQSANDAHGAATENEIAPKIRDDPRFAKYFKMLKMGLPMGAVKNAMQRDQQDPTIMDLDPEKSFESQRPPDKEEANDPPLKDDPMYSKYFKMLQMGLPMGAVQNAMQRDGLDPTIMDLDPQKSVASQRLPETVDDGPPLKDDPTYSKFFKMLKMGLPMGAVKNAMQRDGLDSSIMDLDPEKSVASQLEKEEDVDDGPPLKEDPTYMKYFKMAKMGLPMGAVKNAMQRDGLDPSIMDLDPEKSVASQLETEEEIVDNGPPLKEDPTYMKYFKMAKMGLPMGAVKNAMQRDGLDPSIMDLDPEKSVASQLNKEEEIVDNGPPLKDDSTYVKYFKMLKMGLPMGAVKNALGRDGLDPSIMDLDPEKSVEYQKAMASQKSKKKKKKKAPAKDPKKPKVRRKKIYWSPIEESKIDDNSLWSMIKGSFDFDSLKVDQDEFQSLFTDTSNPADKKKADKEKPTASKQKKSVQVIDAKRGMNGGIILARIKIEFPDLAGMVTEMDCGKLDDTQLKALREFLPTKDERLAIEGYVKGASSSQKTREAAIHDFCLCEKYMFAMMKVDSADEKFECMLFKYQFDNKLNELMDGVTTLISACEEVQKSVRLRKLMAMILMLGNQINTGGSGTMAQGFTLDALLKLDEAKAFDKKTSVLQYLVKLVKANEPDLLKVHDEMPSIVPAENVITESLVSELKELNDQLTNVKGTAEADGRRKRHGKDPEPNKSALDKLRHQKTKIKDIEGVHMYNQTAPVELTAMEKFALYAEKRTKEAFARIDEVQENFKGVLSYFGEDPSMTSSDFFGTLNKFIATFDSALEVVKRIEALKLAEEKKAAAQKAKAKTKKAAKAAAAAKSLAGNESKQGSKGKLDLSGQRKQFADPFAGPDTEVTSTQTETEQAESGGNPRAALMSMLNKRAPSLPAEKPKGTPPSNEEEKKEDPRATLMSMLNNRAPLSSSVELKMIHPQEETEQADPRAALMSMLSKRAPPAEERKGSKPLEHDAYQEDPRAALMSMLNNRAPPPEEELKSPSSPKEEAKGADPRAALISMLSKRSNPPEEEPKSTPFPNGGEDPRSALMTMLSKHAPSSPKEEGNRNPSQKEEAEQPDPRVALVSMLSKRAPQSVDKPKSASPPEEEAEQTDPRAALMSMLNKRAPPPAEEPKSAPTLKEEEVEVDPRAALMSMISKRAAPATAEEPKSAQPLKSDVDQADPRAALISMLNKNAPPLVDGPKIAPPLKEEDDHDDPRAALMSMLSKRGPPHVAEESESTSTPNEEGVNADPRDAIMSMLSKRAPSLRPEEQDSAPPLKSEAGQAGPRAAPMSMLNKRASSPGAEEAKPEAAMEEEVIEGNISRGAVMAIISTTAPQAASEKKQPKGPDTSGDKCTHANPGTNGFFPATTRDAQRGSKVEKQKRSARAERYDTKTSSNARGTETSLQITAQLHQIDVPCVPSLEENESEILPSPRTEAKVMLVAAMAAAAATNRNSFKDISSSALKEQAPVKEFDSEIGDSPIHIDDAAVAARIKESMANKGEATSIAAASKKLSLGKEGGGEQLQGEFFTPKKRRETVNMGAMASKRQSLGKEGGGEQLQGECFTPKKRRETVDMGALAPAASTKKNFDDNSGAESGAAWQQEWKQRSGKKLVEVETLTPLEEMSIAACAVATVECPTIQKLKKPRQKSTEVHGAPMGIAAMAAAAARKKKTNVDTR